MRLNCISVFWALSVLVACVIHACTAISGPVTQEIQDKVNHMWYYTKIYTTEIDSEMCVYGRTLVTAGDDFFYEEYYKYREDKPDRSILNATRYDTSEPNYKWQDQYGVIIVAAKGKTLTEDEVQSIKNDLDVPVTINPNQNQYCKDLDDLEIAKDEAFSRLYSCYSYCKMVRGRAG